MMPALPISKLKLTAVYSWRSILVASVALALHLEAGAAEPDAGGTSILDGVTVVGISSLPGAELSTDQLAGNIQSASGDDLAHSHAFDVTEFLTRSMASVYSNDAQGNPLQRDLQVRGFVASPLLGLSQGISVYQDGVRLNEPFGDTVNWALIPDNAIAHMDLIPGSNPLYGQNTLGGALSLRTKNGFTHSGLAGELLYGYADRITAEATFGATHNDTAYFIAASRLQEDGWRDYSPTRATQVFADVRHRWSKVEVDVSLTYANTDLIGNGPAPESLLDEDRSAVFTRPDQTQNTLWMLSTGATWATSENTKLILRAYERHSDIDTLNGDDSDFEECDSLPGIVCEPDEDEPALDQNGNPIPFAPPVDGATLNRSETEQVGRGLALQWVSSSPLFGHSNHFVVGANLDRGESEFESNTELGALDDSRQAIGSGTYVEEAEVELRTSTSTYAIFLSNTLSLPRAAITLAGRYFRQDIELRDQLGTELNGDHHYDRFNPSLGIVTPLGKSISAYASYAQASRAPSPVELTCANPDDPCRLPNAFLSDPPLNQVVAETLEAGLRGTWSGGRWHAGVFRTDSRDDIIFVSAGALTNQGYFTNVDTTRRQGIELVLTGAAFDSKLNWFFNYTWLDATFGDDLEIASINHPEAEDGVIEVERGDRLPGVPQHLAKAGVDYAIGRWSIALDANYAASQYVRGDEANLLDPLPGYVAVNAQVGYQLAPQVTATFGIQNLFDREYATFATLGDPSDVLETSSESERFSTPAAPRSLWIAVRVKL